MKKLQTRLFFSTILFFTFSFQNPLFAKIEVVLGLPIEQNSNLATKVPETTLSEIVLSRDQYIISYNKNRRSPNWVAWKLESHQMGNSGRSNNFLIDDELEHYLMATTLGKHAVDATEFKGSCFDRGHQVPSADRTDSRVNNETTFLMSNMVPQTPYLNRVIWEHLEQYSRDLVQKQGKKLFIVAGPIYDRELGSIGPQKDIPIPSKNFKVIYVLNADQRSEDIDADTPAIAVIMPNILQDGRDPVDAKELCKPVNTTSVDRKDWEKYKTTLSEVERLSGIKFSSKI